ncbi:hypothetical protein SeMB42_g00177 [Synchytrium endobioticum]|uniref:XPA C-terminal domain-containing protein n=1 Tax=Synchytrium endobioticum TaxID=286115 RepID=A0A507DSC5_9FUNG|nr:hypothetical protein SeLEV6574_g02608 [Synchytrium endobioticum]TPX54623.1 hypothetical protein SeMB42_g00177 [Synchytrium endobioticum]
MRPSIPEAMSASSKQPLSPEQIKCIQASRAAALQKQAARKRASPAPGQSPYHDGCSNSVGSSTDDRIHGTNRVTPISTGLPATADTASSSSSLHTKKRRPNGMNLKYYEYNLTTMKDTKGGFLVDEAQAELPDKSAAERAQHKEKQRRAMYEDHPLEMDPENAPRCKDCDSMAIDYNYKKHYNVLVCKECIEKCPDKYSLLTKTECATDYMLTNSELQDRERLPTWMKQNPHKSTWSDMHLFLREHVEAFAIDKYGSLEKMDLVFQQRQDKRAERKEQKAKQKMKELRQKTRTSTWKKPEAAHVHEYGQEILNETTGQYTQTCAGCGISISFESL